MEITMTLEDFFTLTEMKNGLTALSRVEELVSLLQKERDCILKNFPEASRQCSAVVKILIATESKDCFDLFMKLEGLQCLNNWLQEAQKWCGSSGDYPMEELILELLGALKKLPIGQENSFLPGIAGTVKDLFGHCSTVVQDRARALVSSWNWESEIDSGCQNEAPEEDNGPKDILENYFSGERSPGSLPPENGMAITPVSSFPVPGECDSDPPPPQSVEEPSTSDHVRDKEGVSYLTMLSFDLNEGMCSEEMGCSGSPISAPASNITWSRTKDGSGMQNLLDIDLNTAFTDQIPASSCLVSCESSIEVCSRKVERPSLDLNYTGDNDDAPSSHKREANGCRYPSSASSSSRSPLRANIDLNEAPAFGEDTFKQNDCVICIMGTRVKVNGPAGIPSRPMVSTGKACGLPFVDGSLEGIQGKQVFSGFQPTMGIPPQPYGYNSLAIPSFSVARGPGPISTQPHALPQMEGSSLASPLYAPHPFMMGTNHHSPYHLNQGFSRAGFELNVGRRCEGAGNPKPMQCQLEKRAWSYVHCPGSGLGLKRKESDDGWELYPFYKRHQLLP